MEKVTQYTRLIIDEIKIIATVIPQDSDKQIIGNCPICKNGKVFEEKKGYGCSKWKDGCKLIIWKEQY